MFSKSSKNSGSQQDQMVPPPDHLASPSSSKGIIFKYEDWGKPINSKLNNKKKSDQNQVAPPDPNTPPAQNQVPAPIPPDPIPQHSENILKKLSAMASWYCLDSFQSYQLRKHFFKYFNKWGFENRGFKPRTIGYVENKIIHGIIHQIKSQEFELENLVFHDMQEVPWPEDHNERINQEMNSALNNY